LHLWFVGSSSSFWSVLRGSSNSFSQIFSAIKLLYYTCALLRFFQHVFYVVHSLSNQLKILVQNRNIRESFLTVRQRYILQLWMMWMHKNSPLRWTIWICYATSTINEKVLIFKMNFIRSNILLNRFSWFIIFTQWARR